MSVRKVPTTFERLIKKCLVKSNLLSTSIYKYVFIFRLKNLISGQFTGVCDMRVYTDIKTNSTSFSANLTQFKPLSQIIWVTIRKEAEE